MIISVCKTLVEALDVDGRKYIFGHGPHFWQNLEADETEFTAQDYKRVEKLKPIINTNAKGAVFLDQPIKNDYILAQSGYIGAKYMIDLIFMNKSELDWTPQQHDIYAIQPADLAIRQFITRCQQANEFINEVKEAKAIEFTNWGDVNSSGKILSLILDVRNVLPICTGNENEDC